MTIVDELKTPAGIDPDLAPVALITLSRKRSIETMNLGAEKLMGLSRKAAYGRRLSQLVYHDNSLFDLLDTVEETASHLVSGGLQLTGPSLDKRLVHVSIDLTAEGGFVLVLSSGALPDAGQAKSGGLAAFGKILGHEVKNPLAGISGAAQLLLRSATPDQAELLDLVISESSRIARLVDQLSAFELFSSPYRLPCNVHQILDRVLQAEEAAFGNIISFSRNFDPSLPDIYADSDHIHEAFQNIIRNGIEAMREKGGRGQISVTTRFALNHQKTRNAGKTADRSVLVSITDTGPGIPPDQQERIFDMFKTTKATGSGLGLTIANQIIHAHDGAIRLVSRPEHTCFSLFIPIASKV